VKDALDGHMKSSTKLMEEVQALMERWSAFTKAFSGAMEIFVMSEFYFGFLVLGASAALPTLIYFCIGITLCAMYFSPQSIQRIVSKTIFLVTTDDKPVFGQLGKVFGTLAAVIAALVAFIK
jgi:hypothetical protein